MRLAAVALVLLTAACTSGSPGTATPSPIATPVGTPSDHALMLITDECVGLASLPDCANARIACAKAIELFDAARLLADDKQRAAVAAARATCPP